MAEPRRFIQVLSGPRQTGKTTLARQLIQHLDMPCIYASADEPALKDGFWLEQQWDKARRDRGDAGALLVLDEVQKLSNWSESVKRLWDEDTHKNRNVRVLLLGSAPLLMQQGLSDSLAGRFESIPVTHWPYAEMRDAFGWSLEEYLFYGGYPGAAQLIHEPERWRRYILDALVETSISRDVFLMARVDKPALLRRLFHLACEYSGRILSYQKMVGQLQDAGNTTTLAHYMSLLESAGLVMGLQKYAGQSVRRRASSPKLLVLNTALMTATSGLRIEEARDDSSWWGRLVESSVGAHLANGCRGTDTELYYWQSNNLEVDFVLRRGKKLVGIEVKSGRRKDTLPGMQQFAKEFPVTKKLLVGGDGTALEVFFATPAQEWSA
jgi:predicted AAA+ superfamily ATPase